MYHQLDKSIGKLSTWESFQRCETLNVLGDGIMNETRLKRGGVVSCVLTQSRWIITSPQFSLTYYSLHSCCIVCHACPLSLSLSLLPSFPLSPPLSPTSTYTFLSSLVISPRLLVLSLLPLLLLLLILTHKEVFTVCISWNCHNLLFVGFVAILPSTWSILLFFFFHVVQSLHDHMYTYIHASWWC